MGFERIGPRAEFRRWILPLATMALGLAVYTLVQTTIPDYFPNVQNEGTASSILARCDDESAGHTSRIEPARPAVNLPATGHAAQVHQASPSARQLPSLYDRAGARYGLDPRVLRALHEVESTTSSGGCTANRQGSGAVGPFQFRPATFRQYAVDADGDGRTDIAGSRIRCSPRRVISRLSVQTRPLVARTPTARSAATGLPRVGSWHSRRVQFAENASSVAVGDTVWDIEAARLVGLRTVAVLTGPALIRGPSWSRPGRWRITLTRGDVCRGFCQLTLRGRHELVGVTDREDHYPGK